MTIDEVNRRFAVVGVGNRMVVMELAANGSIAELWDFEHFKKRLVKEFIKVRMEDGKVKTMPLADVWLKSRRGRSYDRLVYSMPGSIVQATEQDYNGWQGFQVEPKQGDWNLNRQHILEVICNGDEAAFKWVMNWLAAMVQFPGRHAWVAIVMRGTQGIGKGHFADKMVGKLFGPQQYIHILGSGQLTAEHNEHLSGKVLIFADESTWGGDPRAAAKLKGIITEDMVAIHRKFLKMVDEPSALHILIASNNEWPIPIEAGDRRFTVLDVNESRKQDQVYFGKLLLELANGGRAAMLHDLLNMEVDQNMLRIPYATSAKTQVALHSLKPTEHWWFELLDRGSIVDDEWPEIITKRDLHASYMTFLDKFHQHSRERRSTESELGRFLKKCMPVQHTLTIDGVRDRRVLVPTLAECRKAFLVMMGWRADHAWSMPNDDGSGWNPPAPVDLGEM